MGAEGKAVRQGRDEGQAGEHARRVPADEAGEAGGRVAGERANDCRLAFALFVTALVVTFGCITAVSLTRPPLMFVLLVAMHGGIALFVVSKRRFRRAGADVAGVYAREYVMLVPYLLVMAYSFALRAGVVPDLGLIKNVGVLTWTALAAVLSVNNAQQLRRLVGLAGVSEGASEGAGGSREAGVSEGAGEE